MLSRILKRENAVTGLEASIIMIAFIVLAAVFSFVVLGSGFTTTQKSQDVISSSVTQASSSLILDGDVFAKGATGGGTADKLTFYLTNTAGGTHVDLEKTIITYTDDSNFETFPYDATSGSWTYTPVLKRNNANNLVEEGDVFKVELTLGDSSAGKGPYAYIANYNSNTVSVIDTSTNTVTTTVNVGNKPWGVAVNPTAAYVTNEGSNTVSVIDTSTNTVLATVNVGTSPHGVAVTPDGKKAYVSNFAGNTVSVIDTSTNTVAATVSVNNPNGIAVNPTGTKVYVVNWLDSRISVIDTSTNTVTDTVNTGSGPNDIIVNPAGTKVYVTNYYSNSVSVINTATNTVITTVNVGTSPGGVAVKPDGNKSIYSKL